MEIRTKRHEESAKALVEGIAPMGFTPLVDETIRLAPLTSVLVPEALRGDGEAKLRRRLLDAYNIEVGGGLGPLAGRIWRIGLMGENARLTNVEALLNALGRELR
jgi:alanine-glyoxylate transaminase/serine-glyoxylate transaminase/serine-pyruvate transaminase